MNVCQWCWNEEADYGCPPYHYFWSHTKKQNALRLGYELGDDVDACVREGARRRDALAQLQAYALPQPFPVVDVCLCEWCWSIHPDECPPSHLEWSARGVASVREGIRRRYYLAQLQAHAAKPELPPDRPQAPDLAWAFGLAPACKV